MYLERCKWHCWLWVSYDVGYQHVPNLAAHDDVIKWKYFPRYWPFVRGIHRSPVTRSFDVFFDLRLNERLRKQSWGWWFETPSRPLWRHSNDFSRWWQWHIFATNNYYGDANIAAASLIFSWKLIINIPLINHLNVKQIFWIGEIWNKSPLIVTLGHKMSHN